MSAKRIVYVQSSIELTFEEFLSNERHVLDCFEIDHLGKWDKHGPKYWSKNPTLPLTAWLHMFNEWQVSNSTA